MKAVSGTKGGFFGFGIFRETVAISVPATIAAGVVLGPMGAIIVGSGVLYGIHELWQVKVDAINQEEGGKKDRREKALADCYLYTILICAAFGLTIFSKMAESNFCVTHREIMCVINKIATFTLPAFIPFALIGLGYRFCKYMWGQDANITS